MEEALKRKLNKRNKKKGDESTDSAAPVAQQDPAAPVAQLSISGISEGGPMQGMLAASADPTESGVQDPTSETAAVEDTATENTALSPPMTFQPASGAVIDVQDVGNSAVQRDTAATVECPHIPHAVGPNSPSLRLSCLTPPSASSNKNALPPCKDAAR